MRDTLSLSFIVEAVVEDDLEQLVFVGQWQRALLRVEM